MPATDRIRNLLPDPPRALPTSRHQSQHVSTSLAISNAIDTSQVPRLSICYKAEHFKASVSIAFITVAPVIDADADSLRQPRPSHIIAKGIKLGDDGGSFTVHYKLSDSGELSTIISQIIYINANETRSSILTEYQASERLNMYNDSFRLEPGSESLEKAQLRITAREWTECCLYFKSEVAPLR